MDFILEHQTWLTNMFRYDYEIIYKNGKKNLVVAALSRKYEEEGFSFHSHSTMATRH
jgi:hypothetical protein